VAGGDAYYYYNAAKLLVSGHGFINPYLYIPHGAHHVVQSADFPPLFIFALAIPSAVGLKSFLVARVWCCVLGAAAIGVCGYTGREIGGQRVGLIAAFLLAVYPNIWMTDELALSDPDISSALFTDV
jgi:asparagine N-glycosylation enzyme membrane subunit Stt3